MRIVATLSDHRIIQVEKNPPEGELVDLTGKYNIPIPEGVKVAVGPNSFVLPSSNPDSVVAKAFSGLLAQFPQYDNILFNPLIEDTDINDLDLAGVLNEGVPVSASHRSRVQVGRGTGGLLPSGTAANSVALLESNNTLGAGNERPGVLITDTIDIGPLTGGLGSNDFMVYWYIYDFETSTDVRASFGFFAGQNTPALRNVVEVDQEPNDLEVFISINNGANFLPVQRLVPITFCDAASQIKLAFKNTDPLKKKYVAQYALLF
jgi:hypothetical protein